MIDIFVYEGAEVDETVSIVLGKNRIRRDRVRP